MEIWLEKYRPIHFEARDLVSERKKETLRMWSAMEVQWPSCAHTPLQDDFDLDGRFCDKI